MWGRVACFSLSTGEISVLHCTLGGLDMAAGALQPDAKGRSSCWHFQFATRNSKRAKPRDFIKGWGDSSVCSVLPNGWLASSLELLLSSGESQAVVINFEALIMKLYDELIGNS